MNAGVCRVLARPLVSGQASSEEQPAPACGAASPGLCIGSPQSVGLWEVPVVTHRSDTITQVRQPHRVAVVFCPPRTSIFPASPAPLLLKEGKESPVCVPCFPLVPLCHLDARGLGTRDRCREVVSGVVVPVISWVQKPVFLSWRDVTRRQSLLCVPLSRLLLLPLTITQDTAWESDPEPPCVPGGPACSPGAKSRDHSLSSGRWSPPSLAPGAELTPQLSGWHSQS